MKTILPVLFFCLLTCNCARGNDELTLRSPLPHLSARTNTADLANKERQPGTKSQAPVLEISDAISAAVGNHPALRSVEAAVQRQQHLVYQATRSPNPTVGYTASEVGNDGDFGQQGVFLSQEIVRGCKLGLDGQIQQREVEVQRQKLILRRLQIEAEIRTAYLNVAFYQEQLKLQTTLQKSLDAAGNAVRNLVESGDLGTSALLQSRLEAQRNQMLIRQRKTQLAVARERLAAIIGWQSLEADVDTAILRIETSVNLREAWNSISTSSPEISAAIAQQSLAHAKVSREQAEPIPNLQTMWSVQQDAATEHTVFGIQLGVELPIRDANSGAINAARSETWRAHHEIESIRRSLKQRFVLIGGQFKQADQQLDTIEEELQALAQKNLDSTQRAFRLGEASYLNLLNAQRAYISLRQETLKLYQQRAIAQAHLATMLVNAS